MGIENIYDVYMAAAPDTKISQAIEAVNFWTLSREGLKIKRYTLIF